MMFMLDSTDRLISTLTDHSGRKSLEFEDLFSHSRSQEHHYEDILGLPHT